MIHDFISFFTLCLERSPKRASQWHCKNTEQIVSTMERVSILFSTCLSTTCPFFISLLQLKKKQSDCWCTFCVKTMFKRALLLIFQQSNLLDIQGSSDVCNYKQERKKRMFVFLIYLMSLLPQVPNFLERLSQNELLLEHVSFAALIKDCALSQFNKRRKLNVFVD